MRLRHLLSASLLCWAGMAGARDVHGVNGYYNWTAAQMQANAQIEFGSEGKKWAQWEPSYEFLECITLPLIKTKVVFNSVHVLIGVKR